MAYCFCLSGGGRPVTSPVYTLTIEAPLAFSAADARRRLREVVPAWHTAPAYSLASECTNTAPAVVACTLAVAGHATRPVDYPRLRRDLDLPRRRP